MKTLEQILRTGTTAEQALARVAQQHPTNPEEVLRHHFYVNLLSSLGLSTFVGGALYGVVAAENIVIKVWAGAFGLLSSAGLVDEIAELHKNRKARQYFRDPASWQKIIPSEDTLFYGYNERVTGSPTPVEILLGYRIYPLNSTDDLQFCPPQCYVFVPQVRVSGIDYYTIEEEYTDTSSEHPATSTRTVEYLTLTFEQEKAGFFASFKGKVAEFKYHLQNLKEGEEGSILALASNRQLCHMVDFYPR